MDLYSVFGGSNAVVTVYILRIAYLEIARQGAMVSENENYCIEFYISTIFYQFLGQSSPSLSSY